MLINKRAWYQKVDGIGIMKSFLSFLKKTIYLSIVNRDGQFIDPIIGFCWFEMVVYLVYTILWTINTLHHLHIQILIHKILYFVLIYELVLSALNSICYTLMFKKPNSLFLSYSVTIISLLMNTAILFYSSLLASGLSVVFESLSIGKYALIIISTIMFSLALFALECLTKYNFGFGFYIFLIIFFVIGYLFYFLLLMHLSKIAIEALLINLEMIEQRGINPNTTPTYKKLKMLKFTRNSSALLFFFIVVCYVLFFADVIPFWIIYCIKMIFMLSLIGIICYKCRIRQAMSGMYGDDEDAYAINDNGQDSNNFGDLSNQIQNEIFRIKNLPNEDQDPNINNCNQSFNIIGSSENEDDDYNLNNVNHNSDVNENKSEGGVDHGDENQNKRRNWKPTDILPSIPQIRKVSNKIYSKDPDE